MYREIILGAGDKKARRESNNIFKVLKERKQKDFFSIKMPFETGKSKDIFI